MKTRLFKQGLVLIITLVLSNLLVAQDLCKISDEAITLDNGIIKRVIKLDEGRWYTADLLLKEKEQFCVAAHSKEFSFNVDEVAYSV